MPHRAAAGARAMAEGMRARRSECLRAEADALQVRFQRDAKPSQAELPRTKRQSTNGGARGAGAARIRWPLWLN
jgi:hypothetical protein